MNRIRIAKILVGLHQEVEDEELQYWRIIFDDNPPKVSEYVELGKI